MRAVEVQEIEHRGVLDALDLKLRIRLDIGGDKGRWRNAEHILREPLLVHQLRSRYSHQLDADAHEADVIDVGRDVGTRPRESYPRTVGLRLRKDAAAHILGQAIVDDELAADDPVGLGVASALESSGLPQIVHLSPEARDDGIDVGFFVRYGS